jgi:hypothetical protein
MGQNLNRTSRMMSVNSLERQKLDQQQELQRKLQQDEQRNWSNRRKQKLQQEVQQELDNSEKRKLQKEDKRN